MDRKCAVSQKLACPLHATQLVISLVNPANHKCFTLSYSADTLPCFVEWKSMASGDYALGFEPSTSELDDRFSYRMLPAQASVRFQLTLGIQAIDA